MKAFMKFYLPFRAVVMALGTVPSIFITWPILFLLASVSPEVAVNAVFDGLYLVVDKVLMFGHAAEYPRVAVVVALLVPSLFAYAVVLAENILYPFMEEKRIEDY